MISWSVPSGCPTSNFTGPKLNFSGPQTCSFSRTPHLGGYRPQSRDLGVVFEHSLSLSHRSTPNPSRSPTRLHSGKVCVGHGSPSPGGCWARPDVQHAHTVGVNEDVPLPAPRLHLRAFPQASLGSSLDSPSWAASTEKPEVSFQATGFCHPCFPPLCGSL